MLAQCERLRVLFANVLGTLSRLLILGLASYYMYDEHAVMLAPILVFCRRPQESLELVSKHAANQLMRVQETPEATFKAWAQHHGKAYLDDADAFAHRFDVWRDNLEFAHTYNAKHDSHWVRLSTCVLVHMHPAVLEGFEC
jgi:hypothetical protein